MQRLLATAAVLPLASCTRSDTQGTQTVTIPVASASASSSQQTTQGTLLPPTATATATATAPVDVGYAVVDPMPSPALCMGLAARTKADATWKKDAGGLLLEITATLPPNNTPATAGMAGTSFQTGTQPSVWSGQIISSSVQRMTATVRVRPTPAATSLGISLSVTCAAGPGSIALTASFPSVTDTAKVTLQKHDY